MKKQQSLLARIRSNERLKTVKNIFKNTIELFQNHDTGTQGGALSYYTIFSIAPMLLIIISIAGAVFGHEAIQGQIAGQLQGLMGAESAKTIEDVIKSAYKPGKNIWLTIGAIVLLVLGATGMFAQLRNALNTIWEIKPSAKKPIIRYLITKLFSFAMIGCMAFLMLVSLVIQSMLEVFKNYLYLGMPNVSVVLLKILDVGISLTITTLLFALVYRFISDAKPRWHSVWWGALFTTILFNIGRYLIGLYLSHSAITTTYGAGASILIIMVWVFYSSQIIFFGAEFIHAIAIQQGVSLDRRATIDDEKVGINTKQKKVLKAPIQTPKTPTKKPTRK